MIINLLLIDIYLNCKSKKDLNGKQDSW